MQNSPSKELLQAIAVTAELTGTELSEAAARVMADDLCAYAEAHVLGALVRCRKELKGRMTVADVVTRLADGRPGPEEAWAICANSLNDEGASFAWTHEMQAAFGVALALRGDKVAARMAFKESYERSVQQARDAGSQLKWSMSFGWRKEDREGPVLEAIRLGRIAPEVAMQYVRLEGADTPERLLEMARGAVKKIPDFEKRPNTSIPSQFRGETT